MYVPVGLPRLYSIKIFNCGKPSKVIEKFFDAEEDLINPISAGAQCAALFSKGYFSMKKGVWRSKIL